VARGSKTNQGTDQNLSLRVDFQKETMSTKKINVERLPFPPFVAASMLVTICHIFLQARWPALRYRTFGSRPAIAQGLIGFEVLLLMLIITVGLARICDESRSRSAAPYIFGILVPLGGWIVASFVL